MPQGLQDVRNRHRAAVDLLRNSAIGMYVYPVVANGFSNRRDELADNWIRLPARNYAAAGKPQSGSKSRQRPTPGKRGKNLSTVGAPAMVERR